MTTPDPFTFDILINYLMIGAALFALGMLGFLARRNLIVMFLSAEMMLQGTALTLVGVRPVSRQLDGPGLHDRDPHGRGVRGVDRAGADPDPVQPEVVARRDALAGDPRARPARDDRAGRGGRAGRPVEAAPRPIRT